MQLPNISQRDLPNLILANQLTLLEPIRQTFTTSIGLVSGSFTFGKSPEVERLLSYLPETHESIITIKTVTIDNVEIEINEDRSFSRNDLVYLIEQQGRSNTGEERKSLQKAILSDIDNGLLAVNTSSHVVQMTALRPSLQANNWSAIFYRIGKENTPEPIGYYEGRLFRDENSNVYSNNSYIAIYPSFQGKQLRSKYHNDVKSLCTPCVTFTYSCLKQVGISYIVLWDCAGVAGCLCYLRSALTSSYLDLFYMTEYGEKIHRTSPKECLTTSSGRNALYFILSIPGLFEDNQDSMEEWGGGKNVTPLTLNMLS